MARAGLLLQCSAKKTDYFRMMIWLQVIFVLLHAACSVGSIIWCLNYRKITKIMKRIQAMRERQDPLVPHRREHQV